MSRAVYLKMGEGSVVSLCQAEKVGISAVEALPEGGTRLVCMSSDGAAHMRRKFKSKLIGGELSRERHGPGWPFR